MNHPDDPSRIVYEVTDGPTIRMAMGTAGDASLLWVPVYGVHLDADTLRFEFMEPEQAVLLDCALHGTATDGFQGRCQDADGKYATFTMVPPVP